MVQINYSDHETPMELWGIVLFALIPALSLVVIFKAGDWFGQYAVVVYIIAPFAIAFSVFGFLFFTGTPSRKRRMLRWFR